MSHDSGDSVGPAFRRRQGTAALGFYGASRSGFDGNPQNLLDFIARPREGRGHEW